MTNKNIYFKKIFIYFIAELISDYIKGIILFKLSNNNPKSIKKFLNEEIIYYKKLKNKENIYIEKFNFIKNIDFYEQYINDIEIQNILPIILNVNIFPFCIILLYFLLFKIYINFVFKIIIFALLIGFKQINEKIIDYFILFNKNDNNYNFPKLEFDEKEKMERIKLE